MYIPPWKAFGDVEDSAGSQPRSNILHSQTSSIKKLETIFYSLTKILIFLSKSRQVGR